MARNDAAEDVIVIIWTGHWYIIHLKKIYFVSGHLSKNKELRGGVLFLESLPHTSSGKIKRVKVKEFAKNAKRE